MTEETKNDTALPADPEESSLPENVPADDLSPETAPEQPEILPESEAAPSADMEESSPPETGPDRLPPEESEGVRDGFQPFYEKEAKAASRLKIAAAVLLYILLITLGAGLLGLGVETILARAPLLADGVAS